MLFVIFEQQIYVKILGKPKHVCQNMAKWLYLRNNTVPMVRDTQTRDNTQQFLTEMKNTLSQRLQNPYHINLR